MGRSLIGELSRMHVTDHRAGAEQHAVSQQVLTRSHPGFVVEGELVARHEERPRSRFLHADVVAVHLSAIAEHQAIASVDREASKIRRGVQGL